MFTLRLRQKQVERRKELQKDDDHNSLAVQSDPVPHLDGLVELAGGGEHVDVRARHPEAGRVLGHPLELGEEAILLLESRRPGDTVGGGLCLGQQGGQQKHRGPERGQEG